MLHPLSSPLSPLLAILLGNGLAVQELHPLQQAFLLQTQFAQSSLLTGGLEGGRKDEVHAQ